MKNIFLILFLTPIIMFPQFKIDTLKAEGNYSNVFQINKTKQNIYTRTKEWVVVNFKDSNTVLKMDTDDKIMIKGSFDVSVISSGYKFNQKVYFVMSVFFKERRYKLDCFNFVISSLLNGQLIEVDYKDYLSALNLKNYIVYLQNQTIINKSGGLVSDRRLRKGYEKILSSKKRIEKARKKHLLYEKQISLQIKNQTQAMGESLFNYINEGNEKEDW